jgi:heat shock protein HtpX
MPQQNETTEYSIDTDVSVGNLKFLPEFLKRNYLLQQNKYRHFRNITATTENSKPALSYNVLEPTTQQYIDVLIKATSPIKVTMTNTSEIPKEYLNELYEDLFLLVQAFEDEIRKTTLFLAFMPGEKIVPEKENSGIIGKIFTESMLPLYIILTSVTFLLFWVFGMYGPLIFVAIFFAFSMISGKIVERSGHWTITEKQQEIIVLQYNFSPEKFEEFKHKYAKNVAMIRKKIYDSSLANGKLPDCDTSSSIFSEYGVDCRSKNLSVKRINVYQLVKRAADKFGLSMPKIVITNNIIPNAAAAGPSARLGTMMITTGILTKLEDDELFSVIGHEMSHLKNHDPLVMSSLTSFEFMLRFYVFLPLLINFGFIFFYVYFFIAIGLIYFFGKFLEGRADLDSAKVLGQPKVLAEALRKIGFRRLFPLNKREPEFRGYRRSEWLRFDPHPPTYHRIAQLENIKDPEKIKHTFFRTVKDNIKTFLSP